MLFWFEHSHPLVLPGPLDGLNPLSTLLNSLGSHLVLSHLLSPEDDGEAQLKHSGVRSVLISSEKSLYHFLLSPQWMFVRAIVRSHQTLTVTTLPWINYNLRTEGELSWGLYLEKYHSRGSAGLVRVIIEEEILKINPFLDLQRVEIGLAWWYLPGRAWNISSATCWSRNIALTVAPPSHTQTWPCPPWLSVGHRWFWLTSEFSAFSGCWAF